MSDDADASTIQTGGVPIIVAHTSPFRIVRRTKKDEWSPSLDEINDNTYDYVKLHRLTASLVFDSTMYGWMHVAFDGALILPRVARFWPIENAVEVFNRTLGHLVVGGVFYAPVDPTDVDQGILYNSTGYYRPSGLASGLVGQIRASLHARFASPLHSILLYEPKSITATELHRAHNEGRRICDQIPVLAPRVIVRGISAYVSNDWGSVLSHLWIGIEQTLDHLWTKHVLDEAEAEPKGTLTGRRRFLVDYRTWTSSTKIEMLFQKKALARQTYQLLDAARKGRNAFIHRGSLPDREVAEAALDGLFQLIAIAIDSDDVERFEPQLQKFKQLDPVQNHYRPRKSVPVEEVEEGGIWLGPLPPIPGDAQWGDRPYESPPDWPQHGTAAFDAPKHKPRS